MTTISDAYQRLVAERFPLPIEEQILAVERRIGVALPSDYRNYILEFNGGYFADPMIVPRDESLHVEYLSGMRGIGAPYSTDELAGQVDLALFDNNQPVKLLPIGNTPTGDLILLVTDPSANRGAILFKRAFGGTHFLADSISSFFGMLRDTEDAQ